ncbi:MAG: DUF4465 domain-containing protein [Bacteroidota bacterium]
MMKKFHGFLLSTAIASCIFGSGSMAQNTADFENLSLEQESYYDGSTDHSGTDYETEFFPYTSGEIEFGLNYTDWGEAGSFGGMAYSNQTDTSTATYENYSAYALNPGGANGTENYGIYYPSFNLPDSIVFNEPANPQGAYITNHTWTYHYINSEDTGFSDGDSLSIVISGYQQNDEICGSIEIKLADFTNGNSFIMDDWTWVDFTSFESVKYIKFTISSSDAMVPTYFCIDEIGYHAQNTDISTKDTAMEIYPNPFAGKLYITSREDAVCKLYDAFGTLHIRKNIPAGKHHIDTGNLSDGMYLIQVESEHNSFTRKLIK